MENTFTQSQITEINSLAKLLWNYHHMYHKLEKADILICFTSLDLSVPVHIARLYKEGLSDRILIAGNNAYDPKNPNNI